MRLLILLAVVGISSTLNVPEKLLLKLRSPADVVLPVLGIGRSPIDADQLRGTLCTACHQLVIMIGQAPGTAEAKIGVTQLTKDAVCSRLGSARSLCNTWINSYVSEVRRLLRSKMDVQQICVNTKFCLVNSAEDANSRRDAAMTEALVAERVGTSLCDYCIELASIGKKLYLDEEAEAEVTQMAKDMICPFFSYMQVVCNIWMDHYVQDLMRDLGNKMVMSMIWIYFLKHFFLESHFFSGSTIQDPRQFCINSEYCPATEQLQRQPMTHKLQLSVAMPGKQLLQQPNRVGQNLCTYCTEWLTAFKHLLLDKEASSDLARLTKPFCDSLSHLSEPCAHWVDNRLPDFYALLGSEIDPTAWCINATVCKSTERTELLAYGMPNSGSTVVKTPASSDGICDLCHKGVTELRQMLSDGATRDKILKYIKDQLCTIVPEDKDKCDHAVDTYGPIILQMLASELDPVSMCQIIGLCQATFAKPLQLSRPLTGATYCTLCEAAIRFLQIQVRKDNATKAHALANLESWCIILPAPNRTACHDFLEKWGIEVFLDVDANHFCQYGGWCPKPSAQGTPRGPASAGQPLSYHGNGESPAALFAVGRSEEERMLL